MFLCVELSRRKKMAGTGAGLYHPRKGNYNDMVKCDAPSPDKCRVEGGAIHVEAGSRSEANEKIAEQIASGQGLDPMAGTSRVGASVPDKDSARTGVMNEVKPVDTSDVILSQQALDANMKVLRGADMDSMEVSTDNPEYAVADARNLGYQAERLPGEDNKFLLINTAEFPSNENVSADDMREVFAYNLSASDAIGEKSFIDEHPERALSSMVHGGISVGRVAKMSSQDLNGKIDKILASDSDYRIERAAEVRDRGVDVVPAAMRTIYNENTGERVSCRFPVSWSSDVKDEVLESRHRSELIQRHGSALARSIAFGDTDEYERIMESARRRNQGIPNNGDMFPSLGVKDNAKLTPSARRDLSEISSLRNSNGVSLRADGTDSIEQQVKNYAYDRVPLEKNGARFKLVGQSEDQDNLYEFRTLVIANGKAYDEETGSEVESKYLGGGILLDEVK
jgi:hypothetical protein